MIQFKHRFPQTLLLACAFIAFSGSASADAMKCIDETGAVTLTDVPCNSSEDTARGSAATKQPPAGIKLLSQARRAAETERVRIFAQKRKMPPTRTFSFDIATSAAAKDSLASIDEASAVLREQALAEQQERPGFWAFFRSESVAEHMKNNFIAYRQPPEKTVIASNASK